MTARRRPPTLGPTTDGHLDADIRWAGGRACREVTADGCLCDPWVALRIRDFRSPLRVELEHHDGCPAFPTTVLVLHRPRPRRRHGRVLPGGVT